MFFVHDFGDIPVRFHWDYDRFFHDRWCREALAALVAHPHRTDDPARADFFVIPATLRCLSFAVVDLDRLRTHILGLPSLVTGKPHVVFDYKDSPAPLFRGEPFLSCKSAFHESTYDPARGIAVPQFPRYRYDREPSPASTRRYLAGFKGDPRPQFGNLRQRLLSLHDGERLIVVAGEFMPRDLRITEAGEAFEIVRPGEWPYGDLLFDSTFALLPRANGFALSYRMIECMNAGCVPVILSDGYVLPFGEELDYSTFAVRVPESEVENLRSILEARLPDSDALQRAGRRVYEEYFVSTERIIHAAMRLAAKRSRA